MISVNDYPFTLYPPDLVDPWGCDTRECTSFCAWRITNDLGQPFTCMGNATDWPHRAAALGILVDRNPTFGSVICLPAGVGGAGKWGHVAFVLRIDGPRAVWVEDYNFETAPDYLPDMYHQHFLGTAGAWFIHMEPSARPAVQCCPTGSVMDVEGDCKPIAGKPVSVAKQGGDCRQDAFR